MEESKSVGTNGVNGRRYSHTVWYVTIPAGVDRDTYVENCIRTSTVSLINENSELVNKVPVGKLAMQMIEFPVDKSRLGSVVLCGNLMPHNQLFVLDVYEFSDRFNNSAESEFRVSRNTPTSIAELSLKGGSGDIIINSDNLRNVGGTVSISASNSANTGTVSIRSNGSVSINTNRLSSELNNELSIEVLSDNEERSSIIKYTRGEGFSYTDEFNNSISATEGSVSVNGERVVFGEGNEPLILGDSLSEFLSDLIDEIASSLVTTVLGQSPLTNSAQILEFKSRLESLKSKLTFTE